MIIAYLLRALTLQVGLGTLSASHSRDRVVPQFRGQGFGLT